MTDHIFALAYMTVTIGAMLYFPKMNAFHWWSSLMKRKKLLCLEKREAEVNLLLFEMDPIFAQSIGIAFRTESERGYVLKIEKEFGEDGRWCYRFKYRSGKMAWGLWRDPKCSELRMAKVFDSFVCPA